jgi:peptidoglycan hydrolase CwlO-like protein
MSAQIETNASIADIAQKKQDEINEIQTALKSYEKKIHALKPNVDSYNSLLLDRKELRRTLATKQKEA